MRRKFEELKATLSGFVEQRECLLLVVANSDPELAYIMKTLEGLDQDAADAIFLLFPEPFDGERAYISAVIANLKSQIDAARSVAEAETWPPLPALCIDETAEPVQRLRSAIDHVSSLYPPDGLRRIVWAFLPLRIIDRKGYATFLDHFVPWNGPELWMQGVRVIGRDDRKRPFVLPALRGTRAPGVLAYEPDLSTPALTDALVHDAADRGLPVPERMQALAQLAGLDYAYKRFPQAIDKYKLIYAYFAAREAPVMQALALQGIGDVLRSLNRPALAKEKYQQALTLVSQTQTLPIFLNLTSAIGDVSLELKEYGDADGFFDLAQQLAGKMMNPFAKADMLEKQGIARHRASNFAGAIKAWRDAATLCKTFNYRPWHCRVLKRLIAVYKSLGASAERRACKAELRALEQAMKESAG